ncbi:MAG: SDR family oxidoreductase [Ilumatobacteraceae bacterium]
MELEGRHVVVTGAAGGIGAALAARFHADGARVTLSDRHQPPLASLAGQLEAARPGSAHAVVADVGTEDGNRALIDAARRQFGPIDLFFANAGVAIGRDPMSDEGEWTTAFNVNIHAHRWAARYLLPEWLERGEGYFCSTASAAGLLSQIGSAPYSLTKAAAVSFAEWLSITYGDRGLRVSCLCPQGVNTAMLRGEPPGGAAVPASSPAGTAIGDGDGVGDLGSAVVRAAGAVLEPAEVADVVARAIRDEQFLILPHPEVQRYRERKAADTERWLVGMRALQARMTGGA